MSPIKFVLSTAVLAALTLTAQAADPAQRQLQNAEKQYQHAMKKCDSYKNRPEKRESCAKAAQTKLDKAKDRIKNRAHKKMGMGKDQCQGMTGAQQESCMQAMKAQHEHEHPQHESSAW